MSVCKFLESYRIRFEEQTGTIVKAAECTSKRCCSPKNPKGTPRCQANCPSGPECYYHPDNERWKH